MGKDRARAHEIADDVRLMLERESPLDVADEALRLARQALSLLPVPPDRDLWSDLQLRIGLVGTVAGFDRGDLEMLREGISANDAVLALHQDDRGSLVWCKARHNGARGRVYLGQLTDDIAPMLDGAHHLREMLELVPRDAPNGRWATCASTLGSAWWSIGITGARVRAVRRAIACFALAERAYRQAGFETDVRYSVYNRGLACSTLGDLTGDPADYDRAIAVFETVRSTVTPAQDLREWTNIGNAQALARANRGEVTGDVDAIATAVGDFERLVEQLPRDRYPAWWSMVMVNLCDVKLRLARLQADPAAVAAAAEATREARDVATARALPSYWAALVHTAASARLTLGLQTGDAAQIDRAIDLAGQALGGDGRGPRERAQLLCLRGRAQRQRALLRPEQHLAATAMALHDFEGALALVDRRAAPSLWSAIGMAHAETLLSVGDAASVRRSAEACSAVIEALPAGLRRAAAQAGRAKAQLAVHALGTDVDIGEVAADFRAARADLNWQTDPILAIEAARGEASALLLDGRWDEAAAEAGTLVDRAAAMISAEPAEHARLSLAEALSGTGDVAAYALLKQGRFHEALARHEGGRAHRLRARLRHAEANLDIARALELDRLRRQADVARRALAQAIERDRPSAAIGRLARQLQRAHRGLTAATEAAGLASPVELPDVATLRQAIGDTIVALPVVTAAGGAFLLIGGAASPIGIEPLWLPELTSHAVEGLLGAPDRNGWLAGYGRFRDALAAADPDATAIFGAMLARTLTTCWSLAMSALDSRLREAGLAEGTEVVLVPVGRLSALPLHAAGDAADAFLDRWAVSYAPSLSALLACRRRANAHDGSRALLAITDPNLDFGRLANPAASAFPPERVRALHGADATRQAVVAALPSTAYASFFTHAEWNPERPERSALRLAGNETLAAEDLAGLDLEACRMAVLGACESGVPGLRVAADEFRGMPSALIEAGIPGTLATLWPVFTHSTDSIVSDFFRHHLGDGLSPARALRLAQLRQRRASASAGIGGDVAMGIRRTAGASKETKAAVRHDLGEPVYWAAFAYIGA